MRLYYYRSALGNFGDDLNAWLWEELAPGRWSDASRTLFSGIGTIIGNAMPESDRIVVFSSGAGYSPPPADFRSRRWKVVAVRGPLTAKVLGLPPEAAVADGALLLRALPRLAPLAEAHRAGVVFVPHHASLAYEGWSSATELAGVELLSPRVPSETVVERLRTARLVLAESMHAAIIADALRVPWAPVVSTTHINTFKWLDWSLSLGIPYEPVALPSPSIMSVYDDWTRGLTHDAFAVSPPTVEHVMDHFHRAMARSQRGQAGGRDVRMRAFVRRQSRRLHKASAGVRTLVDRRRIERTAKALSSLAGHRGYLSDGRILSARIEELRHRFDALCASEL